MYGALWRILPGPWWVRSLIVLLLVAVVLYGLAFYAFPWVNSMIGGGEDVTVG